jgi:hypothetical protein
VHLVGSIIKNVLLQFGKCLSVPIWHIPAGRKRINMDEDWNLAEVILLPLEGQFTEQQNHCQAKQKRNLTVMVLHLA